jgi:hypothetical protein
MNPYKKVRPGERLVISARAWNRAQESADRVLGPLPRFAAAGIDPLQYAIVVPVGLTAAPGIDYPHIGVPIKITSCSTSFSLVNEISVPVGISLISGEIAEPTDMRSTTVLPAPEMFALTVEPMKSGAGGTTAVRCAIKGLAIARVRRFATSDRYVALPTRRSTGETVESLRGTLETSAAGYGRIVAVINSEFCLVSI